MMSEQTDMDVDEVEQTGKPVVPLVVPRTGVTIISPPSIVLSLSSTNQPRVIQAVPTTVSAEGKPQRLQIVRLVTPAHQQFLRTQGAPVRLVTTANPRAKFQVAPQTYTSTNSHYQQRVSTSQRLILPASSKPSNAQIVTIPVSHNSAKLQTVLSAIPTVFTTPQAGTSQQVLAILSPQKADNSTVNQPVRVVSGSCIPNQTALRGYVSRDVSDMKVEPAIRKESFIESNQRKPCNCTKSHCLKLYCDCFAKGEFCSNCNCVGCANILSKEEQRQKAIKQCLLRNPHAFHPKIGKGESAQVRRHQKGCNCKRSGCLKNYCECFEARIMCGTMCKCVGCKNCEENSNNVSLMRLADAAMVRTMQQTPASDRIAQPLHGVGAMTSSNKQRESMKAHLDDSIIEGVLDCLLSQCREAEVAKCKLDNTQKLILEEFGRCVTRIIKSSSDIPPDY